LFYELSQTQNVRNTLKNSGNNQ